MASRAQWSFGIFAVGLQMAIKLIYPGKSTRKSSFAYWYLILFCVISVSVTLSRYVYIISRQHGLPVFSKIVLRNARTNRLHVGGLLSVCRRQTVFPIDCFVDVFGRVASL